MLVSEDGTEVGTGGVCKHAILSTCGMNRVDVVWCDNSVSFSHSIDMSAGICGAASTDMMFLF